MKDDILYTIFGGGSLDYDMLDKCKYDFEDIYNNMKMFTTLDEADFNDILIGAIDLFRNNIESAINTKRQELEDKIKYLENKEKCCGYDKNDEIELRESQENLERLDDLYPSDDIEYNCNYLDTQIWFVDDEIKEIYRDILKDEIEKENDMLGFTSLDLD